MRNIRLDLCYDGTRYRGWQRQPWVENTIQGKLETALSRILEQPIEIYGSGRTDAGVHALHQVASFHCESTMPAQELLTKLRHYLPEDIGVLDCKDASQRFHARYNAIRKTYRYRIWNSPEPCVFERRYVTVVEEELDIPAMQAAARHFLGTHDFSSFCNHKSSKKSGNRQIHALNVTREGNYLDITVTGNGFLRNMVRIIAGTLLEVGQGKRDPDSIPELFAGIRAEAGFLAPAQGLSLVEVDY